MKKSQLILLLIAILPLLNCLKAYGDDMPRATIVNGVVQDISDCYIEPDEYYMTFYRIILLNGEPVAPTASSKIDYSAGAIVYENETGGRIIVKKGQGTSLSGTFTRPPVGTYSHVIVEVAPMVQLKAHAKFLGERFYPRGGTMGQNPTCWSTNCDIYSHSSPQNTPDTRITTSQNEWGITTNYVNRAGDEYSMSGVTSKSEPYMVYLVDAGYKLASGVEYDTMGTIKRLVMVLQHPITITPLTSSVTISFNVASGSSVSLNRGNNGNKDYITGYMAGPIEITLSTQ
jgi:hypothetical protein